MKNTILLLFILLLCGCAFQGVPANKIKITGPSGTYVIETPKNTEINQFQADVETWGTLRLKFEKWKSTNDPQAINSSGQADVARMQAVTELIKASMQTAMEAMMKMQTGGLKEIKPKPVDE